MQRNKKGKHASLTAQNRSNARASILRVGAHDDNFRTQSHQKKHGMRHLAVERSLCSVASEHVVLVGVGLTIYLFLGVS